MNEYEIELIEKMTTKKELKKMYIQVRAEARELKAEIEDFTKKQKLENEENEIEAYQHKILKVENDLKSRIELLEYISEKAKLLKTIIKHTSPTKRNSK